MKKNLLFLLTALPLAFAFPLYAAPTNGDTAFFFAIIDLPSRGGNFSLQAEIDHIRPQQLAFIVANGVRAQDESCDGAWRSAWW